MKRLGLKIAVLLCICLPIDRMLGWGISNQIRARQVDDRIERLMTGQLDAEVIVLGSSRALNDVNAGLLGEKLGRSAYNLGFSGSSIDFHAALFRLMKSADLKPATLVLLMDERRSFIPQPKAGFFRTDKLLPFTCFNPVLKEVTEHSTKNYWASRISHAYRENGNFAHVLDYWTEGREPRNETNDIDGSGSVSLEGTSPTFDRKYNETVPAYQLNKESHELTDAFRFLVNVCDEEGIDLIVLFPPNHYVPSQVFRDRVHELGGDSPTYLDMGTALTDTRYFFDHGHLNKEGNTAFTLLLAEALQPNS